jgi:putative sigma-54 modulation protein
MKTKINSVHFKTDKKLEEFIQERVKKLSNLYDGVVESEVSLKLENSEKEDNKVTEIRLAIKGNDLFAKKQSKTFEESIDLAVEALRKQLVKHKEKIKGI